MKLLYLFLESVQRRPPTLATQFQNKLFLLMGVHGINELSTKRIRKDEGWFISEIGYSKEHFFYAI
jgi:hypothetical protein